MEGLTAPKTIETVDAIDFLQDVDARRGSIIDLSPVEFIKPVGVVALLAALERLTKQPDVKEMTLKLPEHSDVRAYLRLAGVFDVMRALVSFSDPQPEDLIPAQSPVRPMVPCEHFDSEDDIERLANQMQERFQTELAGYGSILESCHMVYSELATIVAKHAESAGGYVLAQQYNYRSGPIVEIAVADCGIGIKTSLQKNGKHKQMLSDAEAIELAVKEGVSSLDDRHRGYGLYYVSDNVKRHNDRSMTIRSGHGTMMLQGNGTVTKSDRSSIYSGTIVNVIIPCS